MSDECGSESVVTWYMTLLREQWNMSTETGQNSNVPHNERSLQRKVSPCLLGCVDSLARGGLWRGKPRVKVDNVIITDIELHLIKYQDREDYSWSPAPLARARSLPPPTAGRRGLR